jgi:hypothetical protein
VDQIHCVGDSHVDFFHIPPFIPRWLGPLLAYNLSNKLDKIYELKIPLKSKILMCFGEIDCRFHLPKQARLQNKNPDGLIKECVSRYIEALAKISQKGYIVGAFGPIASSVLPESDHKDFPRVGDCVERNKITKIFNEELSKECKNKGLKFVTLFPLLLKEDGTTKQEFYSDAVHLSGSIMPIAKPLILKEFGVETI